MAAHKDPAYLKDAAKLGIDVSPIDGDDIALDRAHLQIRRRAEVVEKLIIELIRAQEPLAQATECAPKRGVHLRAFSFRRTRTTATRPENPMPHDASDQTHWHEPKAGENAGFGKFKRPAMPYDRFMEAEGVPIYPRHRRAPGAGPAAGSRGSGSAGAAATSSSTAPKACGACYVVEVPGAAARSTSNGISTRRSCWSSKAAARPRSGRTARPSRTTFEWQKGSLFTIPLNAYHRFVNASSPPGAAAVRHLGAERDEPHRQHAISSSTARTTSRDRFSGAEDFFKPKDDIEPDPVRGLAMRRTNIIPDIINCELPLDNRRSPGYRRIEPQMAGNRFYTVHRPARDRPLFQGAQARLRGGADLPQGQGLHLHLAGSARHDAVEGRPRRQGDAAGLRAGRHGLRRADERRLVPPAFRHQPRRPAPDGLARPQQPSGAQGRPPGRALHGLLRDRPQQGRQRDPLSRGGSVHPRRNSRRRCGAKARRRGWSRCFTTARRRREWKCRM